MHFYHMLNECNAQIRNPTLEITQEKSDFKKAPKNILVRISQYVWLLNINSYWSDGEF